MKKILSLVLVIAMMASLVVFAAPAASADETGFTVEITNATAAAGDKVTLDVIVTGTTMYSYALAFEYDATRLENPIVTPTSNFVDGGKIAGADYQTTYTANVKGAIGAFDVSGGHTIATITFDVVEGAEAGDAYVKCAPFKNDVNIFLCPTNNWTDDAVFDWTSIDGKVTILPEGYEAPIPVLEESDFTYADNGDGTATLLSYTGPCVEEAWIPSTIAGLTVTTLADTTTAYLFPKEDADENPMTFTTLWVPETVTTINRRAFGSDITNLYILNANVKFVHKQSVNIDGVNFFGPAGSTAIDHIDEWCTNEEEFADWTFTEYDYVAPTNITITAGSEENTYVVSGDQIAAPGAAIVAGKPVVAWKVNGAAVLPGAAVAINGDTTFEAMTVDMATVNGASMKVTEVQDELALRFTATINIADYEAIVEAFDGATISHGMLIVPQQYVARAGGFTHAALDALELADGKGRYLDFQMAGCYETTGTDYVLAANVNGFKPTTLAKNPKFNAVGYIAITIGEETTYVYSNYSTATSRDLKSVAQATLATTSKEADAYKWLGDLITSITG